MNVENEIRFRDALESIAESLETLADIAVSNVCDCDPPRTRCDFHEYRAERRADREEH